MSTIVTDSSASTPARLRRLSPSSSPSRQSRLGRGLLLGLTLLVALAWSMQGWAQTAPFDVDVQVRDARERVTLDQSQFEYLPGYFFDGEGDRAYDPDVVYRIEYAVDNDGNLLQGGSVGIPETQRFRLSDTTPPLLPLVRSVRGGVVREPFDEVNLIRLVDGDEDDQLQLCGADNDSSTSCPNVDNKNKNSFYHAYSSGHRTADAILAVDSGIDITDTNFPLNERQEQECYNAYLQFGLPVTSETSTC